MSGCQRGSLPFTREAVELLTPPRNRFELQLFVYALNSLGLTLQALGCYEDAEAVYVKGLACGGDLESYSLHLSLATLYREMGRLGEAMAHAQTIEQGLRKATVFDAFRWVAFSTTIAGIDEAMGQEEQCWEQGL